MTKTGFNQFIFDDDILGEIPSFTKNKKKKMIDNKKVLFRDLSLDSSNNESLMLSIPVSDYLDSSIADKLNNEFSQVSNSIGGKYPMVINIDSNSLNPSLQTETNKTQNSYDLSIDTNQDLKSAVKIAESKINNPDSDVTTEETSQQEGDSQEEGDSQQEGDSQEEEGDSQQEGDSQEEEVDSQEEGDSQEEEGDSQEEEVDSQEEEGDSQQEEGDSQQEEGDSQQEEGDSQQEDNDLSISNTEYDKIDQNDLSLTIQSMLQDQPNISLDNFKQQPIVSMDNESTFKEQPIISLDNLEEQPIVSMDNESTFKEQPIISLDTFNEEPIVSMDNESTFKEQPIVSLDTFNEEPIVSMDNESTFKEQPIVSLDTFNESSFKEQPIVSVDTFREEPIVSMENESIFKEEPIMSSNNQIVVIDPDVLTEYSSDSEKSTDKKSISFNLDQSNSNMVFSARSISIVNNKVDKKSEIDISYDGNKGMYKVDINGIHSEGEVEADSYADFLNKIYQPLMGIKNSVSDYTVDSGTSSSENESEESISIEKPNDSELTINIKHNKENK